jgi:hypothetical protein
LRENPSWSPVRAGIGKGIARVRQNGAKVTIVAAAPLMRKLREGTRR